MNKFVIVNDELRIGDVNDYQDLIGDNNENDVKSKGLWRIIHRRKSVYFYGDCELNKIEILSHIKKAGFYSPLIQGYKWFFSNLVEPNDYLEIK